MISHRVPFHWLGLVLGLMTLAAAAREGQVRTTAGATLRGAVEVGAAGILVTPSGGTAVTVPVAELVELNFDSIASTKAQPQSQPQTQTQPLASGTNLVGTTATGATNTPSAASPATNTTPTAAASPTNAVVGWEAKAIGPGATGTFTPREGGWTVAASGAGIRGTPDNLFLVARKLEVSGQIVGALDVFAPTNNEAMAGLMLRDNLGESAAYAFLGMRSGAATFQYRQIAGGMTMRVTNALMSLPAWFKLSRLGGAVVAEISSDCITWRPFGQANVNLGQNIRAGIAVASGVDDSPITTVFREPTVGASGLRYAPAEGYPRVVLRGGSVLIGPIESADESVLRLGGALSGGLVAMLNVARVEFVPQNPELQGRLESDRPGLVMTDGDFLEGTLRRIATNQVTMGSLLLGFRSFSAGSEAATLQVAGVEEENGAFRVRLRNGSELRARALVPGEGTLRAESPLLGALTLKASEITSVRRTQSER